MSPTDPPSIEPWLLELLRCPVTGAPLHLREHEGRQVLVSTDAQRPLSYPVRDGVPVLLVDEARPATA